MRLTTPHWRAAFRTRVAPHWRGWLIAVCATLGSPGTTHAGAACSIAASSVNFGIYDPTLAGPDDSAGTLTVTCVYVPPGATNVNYTVVLSPGMNSATAATRQMAAGTSRLGYNLFEDPARSSIWGSGLSGTVLATGAMTVGPGVGNGTRTATHTLYGRIPGLQDALPGSYMDTLVVSLNY
jgi:spore coat protein U-like protein